MVTRRVVVDLYGIVLPGKSLFLLFITFINDNEIYFKLLLSLYIIIFVAYGSILQLIALLIILINSHKRFYQYGEYSHILLK